MKFDFTTIYDRRGRDAMAVDAVEKIPVFQPNEGFDAIPMWVADMNFATAPAVTEAIRKRLEHPLFGYFMTSDEYFDSIIRWQERRNGVTGLEKEHIGYENGVLGGHIRILRQRISKNPSGKIQKKKRRYLRKAAAFSRFSGCF